MICKKKCCRKEFMEWVDSHDAYSQVVKTTFEEKTLYAHIKKQDGKMEIIEVELLEFDSSLIGIPDTDLYLRCFYFNNDEVMGDFQKYLMEHPSKKVHFEFSLFSNVHFDNMVFSVPTDFRHSVFEGITSFKDSIFKEQLVFEKSEFNGIANFYRTRFEQSASFNNVKFFDNTSDEKKCTSSPPTIFDYSSFRGYTSFFDTMFGAAQFLHTAFMMTTEFASVSFKGSADFTMGFFGQRLEFNNTKFFDGVCFTTARLNQLKFEGGCDIVGRAEFLRTTCTGRLRISNTVFHGDVLFGDIETCKENEKNVIKHNSDSEFLSLARFEENVIFEKKVDFSNVRFDQVRFAGVEFKGEIFFYNSKFNGEFTFEGSTIKYSPVFVNTRFEKHLTFNLKPGTALNHLVFKNSWFGENSIISGHICFISLRGSVIDGVMNIKGGSSKECNPALDLYDIECLGALIIDPRNYCDIFASIKTATKLKFNDENDLLVNGNKCEIPDSGCMSLERKTKYDSESAKEVADQFHTLKEAFHERGLYEDEDRSLFEYMRARNKQRKDEGNQWRAWIGYFTMGVLGGYGVKPSRTVIWMFLIPLIFGLVTLIYFKWSLGFWDDSHIWDSFIAFLTLGFGLNGEVYVYYPDWVKLILAMEGFIGLFLMAYFTVSVSKKVLR